MKQKVFFVFALMFFFSCSSAIIKVKIAEDEHDFGIVCVNYNATYDFVLENRTSKEIEIWDATVYGTNEFSIVTGGTGSKILPKSMLVVKVKFDPVDEGYEQATLVITHSASRKEIIIELQATGETKPEFDINLTSHDFGKLIKGLKLSKDFIVSNTGTAVLELNTVSFSGSDSVEFSITSGGNTPINLDPGNSHTITVEWLSAGAISTKSASLDIDHNAEGSPSAVAITGETLPYIPVTITTTTLPSVTNWTAYCEFVQTKDGTGCNAFSIITGQLPGGVNLNPTTGEVSGTPHYCGKYDFEIQVDDGLTKVAQTISLEVTNKGVWDDVTPSGFNLTDTGAIFCSHNHKLYIMDGGSTSINIYDPLTGGLSNASVTLYNNHRLGNACSYKDYIYIIGGNKTDVVERYDVKNNTISLDTSTPTKLYDFAVGVYNDEIYCISGAGSYTSVYKFTPGSGGSNGSWTTLTNTATSCFGAGLTIYNNKIYLFGGYSSVDLNPVRTYDPSSGAENLIGNLYTGAGRHFWGRIGDILYIKTGDNTDFQYYDLATNSGGMLSNCPTNSISFAAQYSECEGKIFATDFKTKLYAYTP